MSHPSLQKYYFIDESVNVKSRNAKHGKESFDHYVKAAQHWARRAVERLRDGTDTDFARVFNIIFKTPRDDKVKFPNSRRWQVYNGIQPHRDWIPTADFVISVLSDFANNWAPTQDRRRANVRFYSDDHSRLFVAPNGMYYDRINHIYYPVKDADVLKKLDMSQAFGSSVTPGGPHVPHINEQTRQASSQEVPGRMVIEICDGAWNSCEDWDQLLGGVADLSKVNIELLAETSMTRLILHETLHAPPYLLDDANRDDDKQSATGGWKVALQCKKGETHRNAESFALLGLWAMLADTRPLGGLPTGGYSLDRSWDQFPGTRDDIRDLVREKAMGCTIASSEKWMTYTPLTRPMHFNAAMAGCIIPYPDITGTRRQ